MPNSFAFQHSLQKQPHENFCPINITAIGPDLKVYGCHHEDPAMLIGSIVEGTVNEAGINAILKHRAVKRSETEMCRNCPANDFCPVLG